ncbi:hypothetical protein [Planctomicrobium sp. SH527]|uniref:hypothetical protein n=1 Tax=Planctomicrobium sp. SH527 TaxID=3448123 RepID=UPI003F5C2A8B
MDVFQMQQGRYLLYLDILGFKEIVKSRAVGDVYRIVDQVLCEFSRRESSIHDFRTLYFSDTIIFYQVPQGWGSWAFSDVYAIAGMAWSALAAQDIPCRGAISFGEFFVELDSRRQHSIFFGKALIEAYETESHADNSDWIGVTICPSAWQAVEYADPGLIDVFCKERRFERNGDCIRLNPFIKLPGYHVDSQIDNLPDDLASCDAPDFPNDVKALAFILAEEKRLRLDSQASGRIRAKYITTNRLFEHFLGSECIDWAMSIVPLMKGANDSIQ